MLTVDVSSWEKWIAKLEAMERRADDMPQQVSEKVLAIVTECLESKVFIGQITTDAQERHWEQTGGGYYGSNPMGVDQIAINPQERLGGTGKAKKSTTDHFLSSMHQTTQSGFGRIEIQARTLAKMTPYAPDAVSGLTGKSGPQPVMVYMREGWYSKTSRRHMNPRAGSEGHEIAKFLWAGGYVPRLNKVVADWIIRGRT